MKKDDASAIPYTRPDTHIVRVYGSPRTPAAVEPIIYPAVLSPDAVREVRAVLDATGSLFDYRNLTMPAAVAPRALDRFLERAAADFGFKTIMWLAGVKRFRPGNAIDWHTDQITFPGWRVKPHERAAGPRTADVSFNVCLAGPDEYAGATFETRSGLTLRLNAGDGIAFPSECEHRVTRMESGRRYTAVYVGVDWRRLPAGGYRPER